jgi:hypothetical protein
MENTGTCKSLSNNKSIAPDFESGAIDLRETLTFVIDKNLPCFHHRNMKKPLLLLSLSLLSFAALAQVSGLRNVYAYAQGFVPGVRPDIVVIEGGKEQPPVATEERVSYLIYAEQSGTSKVSFGSVWIKGKAYAVKAADKINTPLEMKSEEEGGNGRIVLAPASRQRVWAITLGKVHKVQPSAHSKLRKLGEKNEVVLVYTWKNKVYYFPVKKIKNLPPAIAF